jgi:hypothetical protein
MGIVRGSLEQRTRLSAGLGAEDATGGALVIVTGAVAETASALP